MIVNILLLVERAAPPCFSR